MSFDSVPVFDCNAALGRRHNQRVAYDRPEEAIRFLKEAGIGKALVYNPYCVAFGTMEGNQFLLDQVSTHPELVPQFTVSFAVDRLEEVRRATHTAGVRTLRVFPKSHGYPWVHWIAGPWLEWMAAELENAARELRYGIEGRDGEIARTQGRNEWLAQLHAALPAA